MAFSSKMILYILLLILIIIAAFLLMYLKKSKPYEIQADDLIGRWQAEGENPLGDKIVFSLNNKTQKPEFSSYKDEKQICSGKWVLKSSGELTIECYYNDGGGYGGAYFKSAKRQGNILILTSEFQEAPDAPLLPISYRFQLTEIKN